MLGASTTPTGAATQLSSGVSAELTCLSSALPARLGISQCLSLSTWGPRELWSGRSFANGGAMRIAPVGLSFRDASPSEIRAACAAALLATHVHPEAVDGAAVIAMAIAHCMGVQRPDDLDVPAMLGMCLQAGVLGERV